MKSVYSKARSPIALTTPLVLPVMLAAILALSSCSRNTTRAADDPGPAPARELGTVEGEAGELFTEARNSLDKGQFDKAVVQYENLEATYPFGDHAAQARLDVAYAYYQQGELDNTVATLDRYLKLYPQAEEADYAFYLKGLANYSRGKTLFERLVPRKLHQLDQAWLRAASADFETLERKFPQSAYIEDASARKLRLIDQMAKHELSAAEYYYSRSAMVAAINRINFMLEQYPNSSLGAEALTLLTRAHRALGNEKSAEEANALLLKRHPDSGKI